MKHEQQSAGLSELGGVELPTSSAESLPLPRDAVGSITQRQLMEAALTLDGSFSDTYCRFRTLSMGNQIRLYLQGVREPTHTFQGYKAMGRSVIKGARAKAIVRPVLRKQIDPDTGEEVEKFGGFVPVNSEFAFSDTVGQEPPAVQPRTWNQVKALGALGLTEVNFDNVDGTVLGWSNGTQVAVSPAAKYPFKTLVHEAMHCVLRHGQDGHDYSAHQGTAEFQAESGAYLIMSELSLHEHFDASESRAYIRSWMRDERPSEEDIRPVFGAVDRIIASGWINLDETSAI